MLFIEKSINIYWCNSKFYYDEKTEGKIIDFLDILYEFMERNNINDFVLYNKNIELDDFHKNYYEYISMLMRKLYKNVNQNSINKFKQNLYEYIKDYKNKNESNKLIDLVFRVKEENKLKNEEAAIISIICYNEEFISKLEENAKSNQSEEDIKETVRTLVLNDYEEQVFRQIIKDKKNEQKKKIKESSPYNKNENEIKINIDNNIIGENIKVPKDQYCEIKRINNNVFNEDKKENNIIKKNPKLNINESENAQSSNEINNIKDAQNSIEDEDPINNEEKEEIFKNNEKYAEDKIEKYKNKEECKKQNSHESESESEKNTTQTNDNNFNKENNMILKELEELKKANLEFQKLLVKKEEAIDKLNQEFHEYKLKNEEEFNDYKSKNEKTINKLNQELLDVKNNVELLNSIHERIYFRDISKFYIREFVKKYDIVEGINMYKTCQNILGLNLQGKKFSHLKSLIIKIINHYLSGNKLAHFEYLINKYNNLGKKFIMNKVNSEYNNFMQFTENEQKCLSKNFNFYSASYLFKKFN